MISHGKDIKIFTGERTEKYLKKLRGFYDDVDMIKVITGVRRCGKSSLMEMVCGELLEKGIDPQNIIYIHLDRRPYKSIKTSDKLEEVIDAKAVGEYEKMVLNDSSGVQLCAG